MAGPNFRIISIGTLDAHPLWGERGAIRTGHATTTLVEAGDRVILVDPSLPPAAMAARLGERSPIRPEKITDVFVTSWDRLHTRAIELFETARWLVHEPERAAAAAVLEEARDEAGDDPEVATMLDAEMARLQRCEDAPDTIAPGVDLFPLPGVTPGCCGLLLARPGSTVLITGDAIATVEHLEEGKVVPTCQDVETAQASFRDAIEIADVIIPGRDNVAANPVRRIGAGGGSVSWTP